MPKVSVASDPNEESKGGAMGEMVEVTAELVEKWNRSEHVE